MAAACIAHKSPRICERCRLRSIPKAAGLRRQKLRPPRRRAIHQSRRGKRSRSEQLPADRRAWRGVASNAPASRERLPPTVQPSPPLSNALSLFLARRRRLSRQPAPVNTGGNQKYRPCQHADGASSDTTILLKCRPHRQFSPQPVHK